MRSSHGIRPVFDEANLVSATGLAPVMALADKAGLTEVLTGKLTVQSPSAVLKARSIIAGMLVGVDDIDGMDILRTGGMTRLLGAVGAPSTLGTYLRAFTHGHALQLGAVNRCVLSGLAKLVPSVIGDDELIFVDVDDTVRATHGYQK